PKPHRSRTTRKSTPPMNIPNDLSDLFGATARQCKRPMPHSIEIPPFPSPNPSKTPKASRCG
ncbi:hypothetical protein KXW40_009127, partial [Aspergillus fumigatus]